MSNAFKSVKDSDFYFKNDRDNYTLVRFVEVYSYEDSMGDFYRLEHYELIAIDLEDAIEKVLEMDDFYYEDYLMKEDLVSAMSRLYGIKI